MEKLRKKTSDSAVEQLLVAAYKQGIETNWDRYESMVPLCGFGRLSLCCNVCTQGPCHINPFEAEDKATICGKARAELVAANFLRLVGEGVGNILNYAGDCSTVPAVVSERVADKELLPGTASMELVKAMNMYIEGVAGVEDYFQAAAKLSLAGYGALAQGVVPKGVEEVLAGAGGLAKDKANLLLIGAMDAETVAAVKKAAKGINLVGMCGAEMGVNVVGSYASQEPLLLSGMIDAVIAGGACVSPGFLNIACELDVPVFCTDDESILEAVAAAKEKFKERKQSTPDNDYEKVQAAIGYTKNSFKEIKAGKMATLVSKYPIKGVAIIGGCNNVKTTQDQSAVMIAKELVANDVLVIATGCAAAAIAKSGMMDGDKANHFAGPLLVDFLGALAAAAGVGRLPAVLHAGTCWQLPEAVDMATSFGLSVCACFPEVAWPSAWSTAIATAAMGIPTYVGPVLPVEGTPEAMAAMDEVFNNNLLAPVAPELTPQLTARKAAAKLMGKE